MNYLFGTLMMLCLFFLFLSDSDTKVQFTDADSKEWHLVQTLAQKEELAQQASLNSTVGNR